MAGPGVDIRKVVDFEMELPIATFFPHASLAALDPWRSLLGDHVDFDRGMAPIVVQSHIVRIGGATILVDTCLGEHKDRPLRPAWNRRQATGFLQKLADQGCRPEDIDIVFCTHLHADHVGWNTKLENGRWVPTFPRARYLAGGKELAHWRAAAAGDAAVNHGCYQDSVLPVLEAGRLDTVEDGAEIAPGATIAPLPGHTPGQVGLDVRDARGPSTILCGDAIHTPLQVVQPSWSSFLCEDPAQAAATRSGLLQRARDEGALLMPGHLRGAHGMRIGARADGGFAPIFCGCDGAPLS